MAVIIDKNETLMLKEMEKLEKKQLEEATKILLQFQDKFGYNNIFLWNKLEIINFLKI